MRLSASDLLRLEGVRRGRVLAGPRSVNIHITGACDRRCEFCWYFSPLVARAEKPRELPFSVLKKVLSDGAAMGVEEINLEGGEVILHSRAAEIFRLVPALGMRLAAYTHLAYAKRHLSYVRHADRITVNLSAVSPEGYRAVHGRDGFDRVLANLAYLKSIAARQGKPAVILTFIIYERNAAGLPSFMELADRLGVDRVIFRLFKATREMAPLVFKPATLPALKKSVDTVRRRPWKTAHNLDEIARVLGTGGFFEQDAVIPKAARHNDRLFFYDNTVGRTPCFTGWFYSYIDELGRVIAPCDNVGVCVAGNVRTRSFRDIWFHSAALKKIRREAACGIDTSRGRWIECRYCGHAAFNWDVAAALAVPRKAVA